MAAPSQSTKRKGPWHCDLCNVSVSCKAHLDIHFSGKKHRSKEDQSMNQDRTHCGLCNVKLTSSAMAADHYSGKKHKAKESEESFEKLELWCGVCNLKCDSQATMRSHREGRKHRNRVEERIAGDMFDEMCEREEKNGNRGDPVEEKGMGASRSASAGDAIGGKGKEVEGSGNGNGSHPVEEKGMEASGSECGGNWNEAEGSGNGVSAVSALRPDGHVSTTAPTPLSETNAVPMLTVSGPRASEAGSEPVGKVHEEAEANGVGGEPPGKLKGFLCLFCKVKFHSMNELMEHRRSEEHKARR